MFAHQVAALCCTKWSHGRHLDSVTSSQKSNFVNWCVFTWRIICRISWTWFGFEMAKLDELYLNKNKVSSNVESIPDPTMTLYYPSCKTFLMEIFRETGQWSALGKHSWSVPAKSKNSIMYTISFQIHSRISLLIVYDLWTVFSCNQSLGPSSPVDGHFTGNVSMAFRLPNLLTTVIYIMILLFTCIISFICF